MSNFLKPVLEDLLKVPISEMSNEWVKTHRKKLFLGWGDKDPLTSEYLSRKPTLKEQAMFAVELERLPTLKEAANVGVEAAGMQLNLKMEWTGTVLQVGKEAVQFVPIPHKAQEDLTPYDVPVAVVASMMLKEKDGELDASISPTVVSDGPLESLMTQESYIEYVAQMAPLLESKKVGGKGELLMRSVHEALYKSTPEVRSAARHLTNKLFAPAKLSYAEKTKSVLCHKNFTYEHKGVTTVTDNKGVITYVPASVPIKMAGTVKVIPTKQAVEKNAANIMISHVSSRFPPLQVKAWGYRGLPSKTQRLFMEHRPFLNAGAVIVDPDTTMSKWMETNGYGGQIRFGGGTIVKGTYDALKDVVLEHHDYKEARVTLGSAIFFGNIKFSPEFWRKYKVLSYRLDPKGKLYYVEQSFDTSAMATEYCGWKLRVFNAEAPLIIAYKELAAEMVQHLFIGSYGVKGKQYAALKYPVTEKLYDTVDMSAITLEETHTTWAPAKIDTGMVETVVDSLDGIDPNSSKAVGSKNPLIPGQAQPMREKKKVEPAWWSAPVHMSSLEVKNDPNLVSLPPVLQPHVCVVQTGLLDVVFHETYTIWGIDFNLGHDDTGKPYFTLPIVESTDGHDKLYFLSPEGYDIADDEYERKDIVSIPTPVLDG